MNKHSYTTKKGEDLITTVTVTKNDFMASIIKETFVNGNITNGHSYNIGELSKLLKEINSILNDSDITLYYVHERPGK